MDNMKHMDLLQDAFFDAIKILKRLEHDEWGGLLEVMSDEFKEYKEKYKDLITNCEDNEDDWRCQSPCACSGECYERYKAKYGRDYHEG